MKIEIQPHQILHFTSLSAMTLISALLRSGREQKLRYLEVMVINFKRGRERMGKERLLFMK